MFDLQLNAERAAAAMEAEERQATAAAGAEELRHKMPLVQRSSMHAVAAEMPGRVEAMSQAGMCGT
jgi:hypothetical protein